MQETAFNEGDVSSIPGPGRYPAGGNGTHSSILSWETPWTEVPGGLQSMGLQRVRHDWATERQQTFGILRLSQTRSRTCLLRTQGSPRVPIGQVLQAGPTAPQELLPQQVAQFSWRIRRVWELPLSRTGASLSCGCCLGCAAGPPQKSLPFPSLGDLPDSRIEPRSPVSPTLQIDSLPNEPWRKSSSSNRCNVPVNSDIFHH